MVYVIFDETLGEAIGHMKALRNALFEETHKPCEHKNLVDDWCGAPVCVDCGRRGEYTYGGKADFSEDAVSGCDIYVQDGFCKRRCPGAMIGLQKGIVSKADFKRGEKVRADEGA